ncbi:hypothetical protein EDC01DRAFT_629807 [Geopyxis carbonaria]|nr:hypothetical protein EDC01DRAFT_629807 [Geopyxis carbonaria]
MTTEASPGSAGTTHVPAWKRVGLKLKYFADTPDPATTPAPTEEKTDKTEKEKKSKKRKATDEPMEDGDVESSNKREEKRIKKEKKKERKEKKENTVVVAVGTEAPSPQKEKAIDQEGDKKKDKKKDKKDKPKKSASFAADIPESSTPPVPILAPPTTSPKKSLLKSPSPAPGAAPSLSRRKSVTFSTDTKIEDGDSIKQLYLALDPFGKNRTRGGVDPKDKPHSSTESSPAKKPKKLKDKTKPKKPKGESKSYGAHLDYIMTFHTARTAWQFQKGKQNWILKHALDVEAIPESHGAALAAYIASLQGAGARDRLLAAAKKRLETPKDADGTPNGEEVSEEAKKRAGLVMKALGHGEDSDSSSGEESSSSEEDSSSDSSDTSSEDGDSD